MVNIYNNSSFTDSPYGLKLQQTITATGTSSVTIPSNIKRVYAIVIGGGGSGGSSRVIQNSGGGGGGASSTSGSGGTKGGNGGSGIVIIRYAV